MFKALLFLHLRMRMYQKSFVKKVAFKSLQVPVDSQMYSRKTETLQVDHRGKWVEIKIQHGDVRNNPIK